MRLVHHHRANGTFELKSGFIDNIPPYAILSHTWADEDQELNLEDLVQKTFHNKSIGLRKLQFCADRAAQDGLEYFWMDTCCIDKGSSAELQEAFTSMFQWYQNANKCYVFLSDVEGPSLNTPERESQFDKCRWFTRGWTLQELIAPSAVEFFSLGGEFLGDRLSLEDRVHSITKLPIRALRGGNLESFTAAERLSWIQNRTTKRKEDKAYSILGLFNIFMPIMYGEGDNAFDRLMEEIDKKYVEGTSLDNLLSRIPVASQAAFNSHDNQHKEKCLPNTRTEILEEISVWIEGAGDTSVFWLNGIAGTGKTTIARTVAMMYDERQQLGASFFFSKGGGDVGLADKLFTTLASQLAARLPSARRFIREAIMEHSSVADQSLQDQWKRLIYDPLSKVDTKMLPSETLVVIDALDECDSENDIRILLRLLATAGQLSNIRLRVFITSRPEVKIRCGFSEMPENARKVYLLHEVPAKIMDRDLNIFFDDNFKTIRQERDLPADWPGANNVRRLVKIACGLFIWASTACRFIRDGKRLAKRRLQTLLQDQRTGIGPDERLDKIYMTVLKDSVPQEVGDDESEEFYGTLRQILGSIVTLFSPLSTEALARILGLEKSEISETLADLHTIFYIPSSIKRPVRLHHPTFRDFLLNKARCSDLDFWVDERQYHKDLGDHCIRLMSQMLKRNICSLSSPGTCIKDFDPGLIEQCIPPELQYACLYWAQHYRQSGVQFRDGCETHQFLQQHFLHWLEVINLIGRGSQAAVITRMYQSLLISADNPTQVPFLKDTRRFIFAVHAIIEEAPLQIYHSALAFIPSTNEVKHLYRGELGEWLKNVQTAEALGPKIKDEYNYCNDVVFTPSGKLVVSGSIGDMVRCWDVSSRKPVCTFGGQADKISSVSISPDGELIASGSDDSTVMVWGFRERDVRYHLKGHQKWVNSVTFSPDGKLLASCSMDETIRIYNAASGTDVKELEAYSSCVNGIDFSPDTRYLASASVDQLVRLWDLKKWEACQRFEGHYGGVNSVRFSPDGKKLVSASDDQTCRVWDVEKGAELLILKRHTKKVTSATFSPDASLIATGSDDKIIRLWRSDDGFLLNELKDHPSGINAVAFSSNRLLLASGSFNDEVRLWNGRNGLGVGIFEDFEETADDAFALTSKLDSLNLKGDNISTFPICRDLKAHSSSVTRMTFSADGSTVATGSGDGSIKIWSREGYECATMSQHSQMVTDLQFSYDGSWLASASKDQTVKVWNATTGTRFHTFDRVSKQVKRIVFSPQGQLFILGVESVRKCDLQTSSAVEMCESYPNTVRDIAISLDDRMLACATANGLLIWYLDALPSMKARSKDNTLIQCVAWFPDSKTLVFGSANGTIEICSVDGSASSALNGHNQAITSVAVSPNGNFVASCSQDKTLRVWDVKTRQTLKRFDTSAVHNGVSFPDDRHVCTDHGVLCFDDAQGTSSSSEANVTSASRTLFLDGKWLTVGSGNILWLPEMYLATNIAVHGDTIVLGHGSGGVTFISA